MKASFRFMRVSAFTVCCIMSALVFPVRRALPDEMLYTVLIGGSRIDMVMDAKPAEASRDDLVWWVRAAAESVAAYYGRYPLPHVSIHIRTFEGRGIRGGRTNGKDGGTIAIRAGKETTLPELQTDWMLTHEMVHLTFPSVAQKHHWIEEGIATYVEPIARVRAGHLDASQMWADLIRDIPQGLPEPGDQGLDNTHTWGRTYWGGALFCLLADVEIHRRTHNHKGLEDALRGILSAGGDIRQDWDLDKTLSVGDRATGVSVLTLLYRKVKDKPGDVDLAALWKQLGVKREENRAVFAKDAPLAATRQAITCGATLRCANQHTAARPLAVFVGRSAGISSK
jgi:hypothetical protein